MPGRLRGSYGRARGRGFSMRPVDSMKNVTLAFGGLSSTITNNVIAIAVDAPLTTVNNQVQRGAVIKAIYIILDVCGLGGTGVLNNFQGYLIKNPGANLTNPNPGTEGTSNEKKFIFKTWAGMIMRNQDGNAPLHWEGWVKIPRRYQRMGTDDTLEVALICTAAVTGHFFLKTIYKWFR